MTTIQKINRAAVSAAEEQSASQSSVFSSLEQVDSYFDKATLATLIILDKTSFISPLRWLIPATASDDGQSLKFGGIYGCGGDQLRAVVPRKTEDAGIPDAQVASDGGVVAPSVDAGSNVDAGVEPNQDAGIDAGVDAGVTKENHPPVLNPIGDKTVIGGATLTFQVTATDPDVGDSLTFAAQNLPIGAAFDAATQTFSWPTQSVGQFGEYPNIIFTVTDSGGLSDSKTVKVNVGGIKKMETHQIALDGYETSLAWTGNGYGVGYGTFFGSSYQDVFFLPLDTQGNPTSSELLIPGPPSDFPGWDPRLTLGADSPRLAWNGNDFGIAWHRNINECTHGCDHVYFNKVSNTGSKMGNDLEVYGNGFRVDSLVWNGSEFGASVYSEVFHRDPQDTYYERNLYFTRLDSSGHQIGGNHLIANFPKSISDNFVRSSLVWTGQEYGTIWKASSGISYSLYFARLDSNGNKIGTDTIISSSLDEEESCNRTLTWTGSEYAAVWKKDSSITDHDIAFMRLDSQGNKIGSEVLLTNDNRSLNPTLTWNGSEYGVAWYNGSVMFARFDSLGMRIGGAVLLDPGSYFVGSMVWDGSDYALVLAGNPLQFTKITGDFGHPQ